MRLKALADILKDRIYFSKVFELIEKNTLPQVAWSNTTIDAGQGKISLTGKTTTYTTLARQLVALEGAMTKVNVSNISMNMEGGTGFSLELFFDPKILREKE